MRRSGIGTSQSEPKIPRYKRSDEKPMKSNADEDWAKAIRVAVEIAKPARGSFLLSHDPDWPRRQAIAANTIPNCNRKWFRLPPIKQLWSAHICVSIRIVQEELLKAIRRLDRYRQRRLAGRSIVLAARYITQIG